MATTSSNLVAGKAIGGRGGNGDGRSNLRAKLAAGVAILGCAGALAFGGLRAGDSAQPPAQGGVAAWSAASTLPRDSYAYVVWEVEQARASTVLADQFTYREDRRTVVVALDWEQAERAHVAPAASLAPTQFGPQEYLPGEEPGAGGSTPSPTLGPRP